MDYKEILVYCVVAFLLLFLLKEWLRPAVSFLLAVVVLMAAEVITPEEALKGFANEQVAVVVLMLIISGIFQRMAMAEKLFSTLMNPKDDFKTFQWKVLPSIGVLSAFVNNTPLVAVFIPPVHRWVKNKRIAPSRILMSVSFLSILGGCVTLIGTSTNLIVNGLAVEYGQDSLGMFDFTPVGGIMFLIGTLYLISFNRSLFKVRRSPDSDINEGSREYFIETIVQPTSPLINQSIEEAGLRNLKGLFLVQIIRRQKVIQPVSPGELLEADDTLLFAGDPQSITELTKPAIGLALPKACNLPAGSEANVVEVVVAHNARIVNQKVKETDFRGRYDGAILAIHRNGERLTGKIGDHEIQTGDVLLVLAGKDFHIRMRNNPGFYVLSVTEEPIMAKSSWKPPVLIAGFLLCIGLNIAGVSLMISLSSLLCFAILLDMIKPGDIRNHIDFNLVLIMVFGLALGKAMISSGAAGRIAGIINEIPSHQGPLAILFTIYVITTVLAALMTAKAAVAITLPVALGVAASNHWPAEAFVLCVAFAGAANFITPIGYQTNLMVYGPGGYKFGDFVRAGTPLTIIYMLVTCFVLSLTYDFS